MIFSLIIRLSRYTKSLAKTTQRLEALLKVIVTPVVCFQYIFFVGTLIYHLYQDPPEGFALNYTLLIGDAASFNFQKVPLNTHPLRLEPL